MMSRHRRLTAPAAGEWDAVQRRRRRLDKQNARVEHDKALGRVMTAALKDDTELFKQFMDNASFKRWLTDTVFNMTYD